MAHYALLNLTGNRLAPYLHTPDPQEGEVQAILNEYANRHPAAPFSLVNLGEALSGMGVPASGEPRPCEGCRGLYAATCPARHVLDRVIGHG